MKPELREILSSPALKAAPLLLGWRLCRRLPQGRVEAMIVETEAYHQQDPASHSYSGMTKRTWPMFEPGGCLYVYFTYGMHYCMNIVVGCKGIGEAVLLRAGEPLEGLEIMRRNRQITDINNLTNGPGKLAQAFGIYDTELSGKTLNKSSIWLEAGARLDAQQITAAPRIGIKRAIEQPWRFYIKDNHFVSKR